MSLQDKLLNPSLPLTLFELVPPPAEKPDAVERAVTEVAKLRGCVNAVNLPEIRNEDRGDKGRPRFIPHLEPRVMGKRLQREVGIEVLVNHGVVYETDQIRWLEETSQRFGISNFVLVGGESSEVRYPGPSVLEVARQVQIAQLPIVLGGICIPNRLHEADRIRRKRDAGLTFFTTQVLFDANDIVWLVQRLSGLEARLFLSFAPVSRRQDLEFLRWLGADIPPDLDNFLLGPQGDASCLERSLALSQRILLDVFDNLPPDPPAIGLNIEHINRRNYAPAVAMLASLGHLYQNLVGARTHRF